MGFSCDAKTLEHLEWPRLAECLAGEAASIRGAALCRANPFAPTRDEARARLAQTSEMRALLDVGADLPLAGVHDLRETLGALGRGQECAARAFFELLQTLQAASGIRSRLEPARDRAPGLWQLAACLPQPGGLEAQLARVISARGELRENASPALRALRHRVRDLRSEIDQRMNALLRSSAVRPYLQDDYITLRDDRPVLPVRADARRRVPGMIHDVSASGTTVFIEPESVVDFSNRLRVACIEQTHEEKRILRELGKSVNAQRAALEQLGDRLEQLDGVRARALLSRRLKACCPETSDESALALRRLRHPLLLLEAGLTQEEVVANDVVLNPGARGLVISGPNAGGKTVVAKAVGLAALAQRAGLHVPCADASSMPLLDRVVADIGDEQDLRSGLSTFSARMTRLATITASADEYTLVILDEVGEGTEPGEGAALAQAVLERLVDKGAFVIATTHFNRLKELAGGDGRFANASVEFDPETLLPTYRMRIGIPGSSGAIRLAQRMGLEDALVERARVLLDHDDRRLEALARDLSELRQDLDAEHKGAVEIRQQAESVRQEYEQRLHVLRTAREKVLAGMRSDLEAAYRQAREEIAQVMRSLQRGEAVDGRAANRARQKLDGIAQRTQALEPASAPVSDPPDARELVAGARVRLDSGTAEVLVLEPPDRHGTLVVRSGAARIRVPLERVQALLSPPGSVAPATTARPVRLDPVPSAATLDPECDLRGLRVDEALDLAEHHLHRMWSAGLGEVRFIHGHGTGALRDAIRAWLPQVPAVSRFVPAERERGGNGVTVVTLER